MNVVPWWKLLWKTWSVRIATFGILISTFFSTFPDVITQAWVYLPENLRILIPQQYTQIITAVIFFSSIVAKLIPQPKVQAQIEVVKEAAAVKEELKS